MLGGTAAGQSVRPEEGDAGDEPAQASIEDEKQEGNDEDDEKLEEDAVEFQKPKMPSAVYSPSKAEMEEHIMTACATYRSWCPHCVASQSKGNPHKVSGESSEIPTLAFDYGCLLYTSDAADD